MIRKLYSLRDCKMNECNPPVCYPNDAVATRAFGDLVIKDKGSMIGMHPEDFALVYLGEIDLETGGIIPVSPVIVATGDNFKE